MFRWLFTTGAVAASFATAICISEREEETAPPSSHPPPSSSTRLDSENRKVKTNFGGRAMQECRERTAKWARADKQYFLSYIKERLLEMSSVS